MASTSSRPVLLLPLLREKVYIELPYGFLDLFGDTLTQKHRVIRLLKAIYGLTQAGRA